MLYDLQLVKNVQQQSPYGLDARNILSDYTAFNNEHDNMWNNSIKKTNCLKFIYLWASIVFNRTVNMFWKWWRLHSGHVMIEVTWHIKIAIVSRNYRIVVTTIPSSSLNTFTFYRVWTMSLWATSGFPQDFCVIRCF